MAVEKHRQSGPPKTNVTAADELMAQTIRVTGDADYQRPDGTYPNRVATYPPTQAEIEHANSVRGRLDTRTHLNLGEKISAGAAGVTLAFTGVGLLQRATEGHTNLPPVAWIANQNGTDLPTTQVVDNATATAPTTGTNTPETSRNANALAINQAMADLQKAAEDNNPALKHQLESYAADVQTRNRNLGVKIKLGVYNGIESSKDQTHGLFTAYENVGMFPVEAMPLDKDNTVIFAYTENSLGKVVVMPILYSGNHSVITYEINNEVPTLSAEQMLHLIGDGITNHKIYFANMLVVLDTNGNPMLHRAANTATAKSLVGQGPTPKYDATNPDSLPNLQGGLFNNDITIFTQDPQQA